MNEEMVNVWPSEDMRYFVWPSRYCQTNELLDSELTNMNWKLHESAVWSQFKSTTG